MNKGDKLRRLISSSGYKMGEIIKRTGMSQSYLSQVLNNHKEPKIDTIFRILKAINVPEIHFFTEPVTVPVIARISAGQGIYPVSQDSYPTGQGYDEIEPPSGYYAQEQVYRDGLYAVQVEGDSMIPLLYDMDYLYIRPCPSNELHKGSLVVFRDHEGMGFVKRIYSINEESIVFEGFGDGKRIARHPHEIEVIEKILGIKKH